MYELSILERYLVGCSVGVRTSRSLQFAMKSTLRLRTMGSNVNPLCR